MQGGGGDAGTRISSSRFCPISSRAPVLLLALLCIVLQAVERLVERHLVRQRSDASPSAAEALAERELLDWFGRCLVLTVGNRLP